MSKTVAFRAVMATTILTALLTSFVGADKRKNKSFAVPTGPSADAKNTLAVALQASKSVDADSAEFAEQLIAAVEQALENLEPQSVGAERLTRALDTAKVANHKPTADNALRTAIAEVHAMLSFEPLLEADLPEGVPTYTPVGAIEVKRYPAYRKATASAFFTLFRHIQSNKIAMTAPVQMEFEETDGGKLAQQSMSFLYGSMDLGETGTLGSVIVADSEPITVVSTGVSGLRKPDVLSDSVARLNRWIDQNPKFERAGAVRVMGYNSPFVPATRQYFEVQIPVRESAITDTSE